MTAGDAPAGLVRPVRVAPGVVESAHLVDIGGVPTVAVLSRPATPAPAPAPHGLGIATRARSDDRASTLVIIVVGGPQYRVGSHRQFVSLARALAAAGFCAMRFDVRGMGDAAGAQRAFTDLDDDVAAAIHAGVALLPGVARVVLWGLCDGASAALMHAQARQDPRVVGLVVANPWVRSGQTLARAQVRHYYAQRLREPDFWRKLLRGGVAWQALRDLVDSLRAARRVTAAVSADEADAAVGMGGTAAVRSLPFTQRMAQAWSDPARPLLLLLSGRDLTAQEFIEATRTEAHWRGAMDHPGLTRRDLLGADHTFSDAAQQREAERLTVEWLHALVPACAAALPASVRNKATTTVTTTGASA